MDYEPYIYTRREYDRAMLFHLSIGLLAGSIITVGVWALLGR